MRPTLPIDSYLSHILQALETCPTVLIKASTGSGKTTRIPPALLQTSFLKNKRLLVLVPRRLAAKMAAMRVASELGEEAGQTVGYQFRFEKAEGPRTRVKFITEGLLLRLLQNDPTLKDVGCVVLDEFHERHIQTDIALALLLKLQQHRPDLRLVIMSATLNTEALSRHLKGCPVIEVDAKKYPVQIHYREGKEFLEKEVVRAIQSLAAPTPNHFLVFLPGMAEIRRCESALQNRGEKNWLILPLHGDLPKQEQELIFAPTEKTKIILATNIAESSLTIDGVNVIIDSGLHRQASFAFWSGIPSLKTKKISQASAEQRAGRAGRTGPGICIRLYSQEDYASRLPFEIPEISRADLTQMVLELVSLGVKDPQRLNWLLPPPETSFKAATDLLIELSAVEKTQDGYQLTPIGREMAAYPLHPRLSRVLVEAAALGIVENILPWVAQLSEGELVAGNILEKDPTSSSHAVRQLEKQIRNISRPASNPRASESSSEEKISAALLAGFPDRVAAIKKDDKSLKSTNKKLLFCLGGEAVADAEAFGGEEFLLILDVSETKALGRESRYHARSFIPLKREWLKGALLQTDSVPTWNPARQKIEVLRQTKYGNLTLNEETVTADKNDAATSAFLLKMIFDWDAARPETITLHSLLAGLKKLGRDCETLFAKLELFKTHRPDLPLPDLSGETLREMVQLIIHGHSSREELERLDWQSLILENFDWKATQEINRLPESCSLPAGRKVQIHYELGKNPWIESRLQDFFGLKQSPSLFNGKLPLTLVLLAPNKRPVQVTNDIQSFWTNTYPEVRKELFRRYPRHKWPEDPKS